MRQTRRPPRSRRAASQKAAVDLSPRNARRRALGTRVRRRVGATPTTTRGGFPAARAARTAMGRWARPGLRVLVLSLELAAAVLLLASPAFAARQVDVSGVHHLSRADVLGRTGLGAGGSVFLVSPAGAESALRSNPYVRTVTVRASLPDRVDVSIDEWEPLALVHRDGRDYLLSPEGTVLGPGSGVSVGPATGRPHVELSWAATGAMRSGEHAISGRLLQDLKNIQEVFPGAYGLTVKAISLAPDQQLTVETREGPRILFGQMVTGEQVDSLDAKLASLKALSGKVDLAHSKLDYVNLMNQNQPVTRAIPSPSPSPSPSPQKKP
ncbi:MAG TPA: FtsQ-type POTRA domain-containing protein [Candidatus Dormibacteraeota bacterium]